MKIRFVLPTLRSNGKFAAVLEQMRDFASGKHEISWNVVCNDDDADTIARMPSWVTPWIGPAAVPYMQRCNEAALAGEFDWFMQWTDDAYSLTCSWDEYIAECDGARSPFVAWMTENEAIGVTVMTSRAMRALGAPNVTWFPFWFTDTWMDEVHRMAFGVRVPCIEGLEHFSPARGGQTRCLRDLAFWADFFKGTRLDRIDQARRLMAAYGVEREIPAAQMAEFDWFDRWYAERVDRFEAEFKKPGEPMAAHYPAMRAAAEAHLARLRIAA